MRYEGTESLEAGPAHGALERAPPVKRAHVAALRHFAGGNEVVREIALRGIEGRPRQHRQLNQNEGHHNHAAPEGLAGRRGHPLLRLRVPRSEGSFNLEHA